MPFLVVALILILLYLWCKKDRKIEKIRRACLDSLEHTGYRSAVYDDGRKSMAEEILEIIDYDI